MMRYLCWIGLLLVTACTTAEQRPDEPTDVTASNTVELDTPGVSKVENNATAERVSTIVNDETRTDRNNNQNNDQQKPATGNTVSQTDDVVKEAALQYARPLITQAVIQRLSDSHSVMTFPISK